jgi:hypothetical protein
MSSPDGPEERTAFYDESFSRDASEDAATRADEARDDLLNLAEAKMLSWAIDRVLA